MVKICEFSSGSDRDGAQTSLRLNHQGKAEPFLCPLFLSESFSLYRLSIGHYLFFGCKGTADDMLTQKIAKACEVMRLFLMDHIILAEDGFYSYHDKGKL